MQNHIIRLFAATVLAASAAVLAEPMPDPRVSDQPIARTADGRIARSRGALRHFANIWPCPSSGSPGDISCPGWAIDHVIPLACGGVDSIENLQWLPDDIKSASGALPKDRWERKVYCRYLRQ